MVVNAVDRERINITASGSEHDQRAILFVDLAFESQHSRKADFRHPAAANGRDTGAPDMLEYNAFAVGADNFLDRGARDCEVLTAD